jgi:uncharacterized membrane protein
MKTVRCQISQRDLPESEATVGSSIRPSILTLIQSERPGFTPESYISIEELNKFRKKYLEIILKDEMGELSHLEEDVLKSINSNELLSENIEPEMSEKFSFGERLSDRIASFGGSWPFIILFFTFLAGWMAINVYLLATRAFDPYPFILLNLVLSCLAAIQAPIIMMSQNRQESRDRIRAEHDYKVNLKAELEIRLLHEKVDHLLLQQNQRLLEIQQIQIDLMQDIMSRLNHNSSSAQKP